jgi:hypothetical protein
MSSEKREKLLHEIAAWRDARNAHVPGSSQKCQTEMKKAEWELQRLGPSQHSPGLVIKIVDPTQE